MHRSSIPDFLSPIKPLVATGDNVLLEFELPFRRCHSYTFVGILRHEIMSAYIEIGIPKDADAKTTEKVIQHMTKEYPGYEIRTSNSPDCNYRWTGGVRLPQHIAKTETPQGVWESDPIATFANSVNEEIRRLLQDLAASS